MSLFKTTVLGLTMAAALALPALAQDDAPYQLVIIKNGGIITRSVTDKAMADELMMHAHLQPAAMVLEHGGKAYLVDDYKMTVGPKVGMEASEFWTFTENH